MDAFAQDLLSVFAEYATRTYAWCLLPNHYHALVKVPNILKLLHQLGQLHGRTSYVWNGEEKCRGRKVFYRAVDRAMLSERHYGATLNYVHHNPLHHRYVSRWDEWPWSSASDFLAQTGTDEAERIWRAYPLRNYGKGWDEADD